MQCPSCSRPNREGARFCDECGAPLARKCPRCGAGLGPGARTCDACGAPVAPAPVERDLRAYTPNHLAEKVLRARSALEGERKQVTVLFADVKGSMELAEAVDPEEWHRIMDGFLRILAEGVHRFEGTVNQYTGDGIMALFGAPLAHEDHARRAGYAALHLRDRLREYADGLRLSHGLSFSVRMGLNSGEVIVGRIGDDLRMDYTAQGHTVGLAARMEQLAEPGRIYLTGATAALAAGYLETREIGPLAVKGAREPVRVFELTGIGRFRTRLDVSRERGFSRFVGRAAEMAVLEEALRHAESGDARVVGVVAEAGVGKSRFCLEFMERQRARGVAVREGRGFAHTRTAPLFSILGFLRGYFGLGEEDPPESARDRIAGRVLRLVPELGPLLPLLYEYLGVGDPADPFPELDPDARQRGLWRMIRGMLRARSDRELLVQVFDDLHWFDPASLDFVARYVEAMVGTRTLLVVNFRPPFAAAWMKEAHYREIALRPLDARAIADLLVDLLGTDPALGDLPARIAERTGGNPFFVEEVVQMLVESGGLRGTRGAYRPTGSIDTTAIPPTVEALIAGRIDRLGDDEKAVLQTAAVIGKEFRLDLLRAVCGPGEALDEPLSRLLEGGMIEERALYPEAEYAFRHPLLQEVAYRSQLVHRRRATHGAAARALRQSAGERAGERAALIAHHYESAGEALEAARWHDHAAAWCELSHPRTAFEHWRRVPELAGAEPSAGGLVLRSCGKALSLGARVGAGPDALADASQRGLALCERWAGAAERVEFLTGAGAAHFMTGRPRQALAVLARAERETSDGPSRIEIRRQMVLALEMTGRSREAVQIGLDLLGQLDRTADRDLTARILPGLSLAAGEALFMAGRLAEARAVARRGLEVARSTRSSWIGPIQACEGRVEIASGNLEAALALAREALDYGEQTGDAAACGVARLVLGWALVASGAFAEGRRVFEEALALARAHGTALFLEAMMLAQLSRAYVGTGERARAVEAAEEAVAVARERETVTFEIPALTSLARARRFAEGIGAAAELEASLDRCLALVAETGALLWEPWSWLERAELAVLRGDGGGARAALAEAKRAWRDMGAEPWVERSEGMLAPR